MKDDRKSKEQRAKAVAYNRAYMAKPENKERWNKLNRARNKRLREAATTAYGGKCACCGETTQEFLTLHHENGDGAEHRRALGYGTPGSKGTGIQFYKWLRRNGWPQDIGMAVMCWNCHMAKDRFGACPHQGRAA